MEYEVRITKHCSGETYNVDLASFDRSGSGMLSGRAFNVSYEDAVEKAEYTARSFNAPVIHKY